MGQFNNKNFCQIQVDDKPVGLNNVNCSNVKRRYFILKSIIDKGIKKDKVAVSHSSQQTNIVVVVVIV